MPERTRSSRGMAECHQGFMRLEAGTTVITVATKSGRIMLTCGDSIGKHCSMITLRSQLFLLSMRATERENLMLMSPRDKASSCGITSKFKPIYQMHVKVAALRTTPNYLCARRGCETNRFLKSSWCLNDVPCIKYNTKIIEVNID